MNKERLTEIVPQLHKTTPLPPNSNLIPLTTFLEVNNCTEVKGQSREVDMCYKLTRALLIKTTKDLDVQSSNYWVASKTIEQLVSNIEVIIDGFDVKAK